MLNLYELLVRFDPQTGKYLGSQLRYWDTEKEKETPPKNLGGYTSPEFLEAIGLTAAAAMAENEALRRRVADLESLIQSPSIPSPQTTDKWELLASKLRGGPLFAKVYVAAQTDVAVATNLAVLLSSIALKNEDDFRFAALRILPIFDEGEVASLNQILVDSGFAPLQ